MKRLLKVYVSDDLVDALDDFPYSYSDKEFYSVTMKEGEC